VESIEILSNHRHPLTEDVRRLSLELAGWLLHLAGKAPHPEDGIELAEEVLTNGLALRKFACMIDAQGGNLDWFDSPQWLHQPAHQQQVKSPSTGYLANVNCFQVGVAVQRSGAGRNVPGAKVSAHAGVETHKKIGDPISAGETLFTVYVEDESRLESATSILDKCFTVTANPPEPDPLIYQVIA
jgi:thymidine phosphorylase